MNGIPFPVTDSWIVGKSLRDRRSGATVSLTFSKLAQGDAADEFDRLDCGPDDLCVTHLEFGGDVRILELVNRRVAYLFDLDTRLVRVEYGKPVKGFRNDQHQPVDPAAQLLFSPVVHSIIPVQLRLQYRADRDRHRRALEEEISVPDFS
jgi:hypothetical protein